MKKYFEKKFNLIAFPTIGADFGIDRIKITVDKEYHVTFQIWDYSGDIQFSDLVDKMSRGLQTALFVFDISKVITFNHVPQWVDKVFADPDIKTAFLIGSKIDLREKRKENEYISTLQGQELSEKLAEQYGILFPYIEVSAKTGEGIQEIFKELSLNYIKNLS